VLLGTQELAIKVVTPLKVEEYRPAKEVRVVRDVAADDSGPGQEECPMDLPTLRHDAPFRPLSIQVSANGAG
jgi:hypothetical protein